LIILGDTIFDVNLKSLTASEHSVLGVKEVDDPRRFGVAETADGYVTKLVEKPAEPKSRLAVVGIYYVTHPRLLLDSLKDLMKRNVRTRGEFQLTDGLQLMIEQGEKIKPFIVEGWYDCGKPETLLSTNRYLLERQTPSAARPGVLIQPPVFISPKADVKNSVIGPYATIAEGASVENAIIRNSIISEGATVANSLLEDSIVGNNAVLRGSYKHVNIGDSSELEFY
jgi:glucose-1-phosphate thymidylyltransferase